MRCFPGRKRKSAVARIRGGLATARTIGRAPHTHRLLASLADTALMARVMPLSGRRLAQGLGLILNMALSGAAKPTTLTLHLRSRRYLWGTSFSLDVSIKG